MPTIARIGNIKIQIFADDHNPPHFHLTTPDHEALIAIADFSVLRGSVRRNDLVQAIEWAKANRQMLQNEWTRLNG